MSAWLFSGSYFHFLVETTAFDGSFLCGRRGLGPLKKRPTVVPRRVVAWVYADQLVRERELILVGELSEFGHRATVVPAVKVTTVHHECLLAQAELLL